MFSFNTAARAVEAAKLAKLDENDLPEGVLFYEDVDTDTQVITFMDDGAMVLCWRATERTWKDWKANFKYLFKTRTNSHGAVHRGIHEKAMSVYDWCTEHASKAMEEGIPLQLYGHSQGAMLALDFADLWHRDKVVWNEVYALAPARIFSFAKARYLQRERGKDIYTVINCRDPVSRIPPEYRNYSHVGNIIYMNRHGNFVYDPGRWIAKEDRAKAFWRDFPFKKKAYDYHDLEDEFGFYINDAIAGGE